MTEELKPCAHCGSTQFTQEWHNNLDSYIECLDCGASACPSVWNRRASPWVRIEDGEPPRDEFLFVWVFDEDGGYPCKAQFYGNLWLDDLTNKLVNQEITHWMPIPPLPEKK